MADETLSGLNPRMDTPAVTAFIGYASGADSSDLIAICGVLLTELDVRGLRVDVVHASLGPPVARLVRHLDALTPHEIAQVEALAAAFAVRRLEGGDGHMVV